MGERKFGNVVLIVVPERNNLLWRSWHW